MKFDKNSQCYEWKVFSRCLDPASRRLDAAPKGSTLAWEKGVATDFQRGYRGF